MRTNVRCHSSLSSPAIAARRNHLRRRIATAAARVLPQSPKRPVCLNRSDCLPESFGLSELSCPSESFCPSGLSESFKLFEPSESSEPFEPSEPFGPLNCPARFACPICSNCPNRPNCPACLCRLYRPARLNRPNILPVRILRPARPHSASSCASSFVVCGFLSNFADFGKTVRILRKVCGFR